MRGAESWIHVGVIAQTPAGVIPEKAGIQGRGS
jgi:hypothetical protein